MLVSAIAEIEQVGRAHGVHLSVEFCESTLVLFDGLPLADNPRNYQARH